MKYRSLRSVGLAVALVILVAEGSYPAEGGGVVSYAWQSTLNSSAITTAAFASAIPGGQFVITVALALFAFTTIIGWSYYAQQAASYLFGDWVTNIIRYVWVVIVFVGCLVVDTVTLWRFGDIANASMAFPNLLANGSSGIAVGMATNIPPHNIAELCDACLHLIKTPDARDDTLLNYIPGPDFPTGGVIVESRDAIAEAYRTGRGSIRLRAKWEVEDLGRGTWQIVVTEIPYQVQKSKLIERIADLIQTKKIPILADIRDESADDIRTVLEPKSRSVDPELLMGMLFRNSDLETRFSLNMNVLIDGVTPRGCSLKEVLRAFLDFRREVLVRRSRHRMARIDNRLEVLAGLITAFLNLDRVIDIIRYDDDPKAALMYEDWSRSHQSTIPRAMNEAGYRSPLAGVDVSRLTLLSDADAVALGVLAESDDGTRTVPHSFAGRENGLSDVQAEAILNMRLRSLRRLEEDALVKEQEALMEERAGLEDLLENEGVQWTRISEQLRETKQAFGRDHDWGARRTVFAEAAEVEEVPLEAMIEREPITVVCSKMGWIRAMKGHIDLNSELKFKDGDEGRFVLHAQTTDKIVVFGSNGRFYTLPASNLPGGRVMGEPVRLMADLPNEAEIVTLFVHVPGRKLIVASSAGDGFLVPEDEILAQTRSGKQALNVKEGVRALLCKPASGDHVACVGENRKVLVFPLEELPEMTRGKGVRLQKFKDGGLSDLTTFTLAEGLSWKDPAGRTRTETELSDWQGKRASSGRMAPRGFPRDNRFT